MMTTLLLIGSIFMASAGDGLEDMFRMLQTSREDVQSIIQEDIGYGSYGYPWGSREVPVGKRAAVVETMARFARAYAESDAFVKWYEEFRDGRKPQPPEEMKPLADQRKAQIEEAKKGLAELEQQRDAASGELRDTLTEALDMGRQMLKQMTASDPAQDAKADEFARQANAVAQEQYRKELADWEREFPAKNPKPLIARRLKEFLEATKGIDYNADMIRRDDRLLFKSSEYENKDRPWKLGYRAGREATEKARAFAEDWLDDLD